MATTSAEASAGQDSLHSSLLSSSGGLVHNSDSKSALRWQLGSLPPPIAWAGTSLPGATP